MIYIDSGNSYFRGSKRLFFFVPEDAFLNMREESWRAREQNCLCAKSWPQVHNIKGYVILEEISKGTYGTTKLAQSEETGRLVCHWRQLGSDWLSLAAAGQ
jgi:hypothetical protein